MEKTPALKVLLVFAGIGFCYAFVFYGKEREVPRSAHAHEHAHHHDHHHQEYQNSGTSTIPDTARLVTGQGEFIFSWNKELTAAFPEDAREFEPAMHGGFNEDPETGIVYTGIPDYGLCAISPDLKEWTKLGTDERLKDNIHGIVFFVHKGKKHLAVDLFTLCIEE